jgi:hypothetical protein
LRGDAEPCCGCGMALCRGFSDQIPRPASTRCRHYCCRRARSRCARRSIHANQSKRSRDANGKATACCSRQLQLARSPEHPDRLERHTRSPAGYRRCSTQASPGQGRQRRRNYIEDEIDRPAALSGVNDVVPGCCATVWLPRGRCLANAAKPPGNWTGSRRRSAPASSLRVPTVISGFANGFSVV